MSLCEPLRWCTETVTANGNGVQRWTLFCFDTLASHLLSHCWMSVTGKCKIAAFSLEQLKVVLAKVYVHYRHSHVCLVQTHDAYACIT